MREIKFRAWIPEGQPYMAQVREINFKRNKIWVTHGKVELITEMTIGFAKLMQFTGLKDKNGKEIYEGDILLAKDWGQKERFLGPVKFQITEFVVMYHKLNNKTWTQLTSLAETGNLDEWEIIGNIYENPKLLK